MNKDRFLGKVYIFTTVVFLICIFSASIIFFLSDKETFSYYENRNFCEFPDLTKESVESGEYFSTVDMYITERAPFRLDSLKASTYADMHLFRRPVVNDVVIGQDVLLQYNSYETINEEEIAASADVICANLKSHASLTESYGGSFYYTAIPCQYVFYGDKYPSYLNNRSEYTEKSTAALFGRLEKFGVNYIDMYDCFEREGFPDDATSTIDNHYGILGAYRTYTELIRRINADTGLNLDILEEGEYTISALPNKYVGSRSRKLFGMWESDERLSIITPNEEIPFDRWNNGTKVASSVYKTPSSDSEYVLYDMYMSGDIANTIIKTYREDKPSILIYGDSFTNALECIIWYSFDTMQSIDFRHYFEKTIEEVIADTKPDVVVCVRDYEALLTAEFNGQ